MDLAPATAEQLQLVAAAGSSTLRSVLLAVALVVGVLLVERDARAWPVGGRERLLFFQFVFMGGLLGSLIPGFWAGGVVEQVARQGVVALPRSILGGLVGGFVGAYVFKKWRGHAFDTSDAFARATVVGMVLGRVGCAVGHCCIGRESSLLGWDQGDGVPRFPVQLLEAAVMGVVGLGIWGLHRRNQWVDRRFFLVVMFYGVARFFMEPLRATVGGATAGLLNYQWIALAVAGFGAFHVVRRTRQQRQRALAAAVHA